MGFHLRKVQSGGSLGDIFQASYHNDLREMLKWWKAQIRDGAGRYKQNIDDTNQVWIKNNSGADRSACEILGIDTSIPVSPTHNLGAFQQDCVVQGVSPTFASHDGKFVILPGALPNSEIGIGQIAGVCAVQVTVTAGLEWYGYADVTNNTATKLTLLPSGKAQVLWRETGTGDKWAIVLLGLPPGNVTKDVKLDGDLAIGGSATASVWAGATRADTGNNLTVYDRFGSAFDAGAEGLATWFPDQRKWYWTEAACPTS
jgi:hypothetical protein